MTRQVFSFGCGPPQTDLRARDKAVVGGKGANLAEMAEIGLPVPPGFTISAEVCARFAGTGELDEALRAEVAEALALLEQATGKRFGDPGNPLLVSVRSGSRVSMPGMMDTILNLGLNGETVEGLARASGDARFAWDSWRRFIQMYADVALGIDRHLFEDELEIYKEDNGFYLDTELGHEDWQAMVLQSKAIVEAETGEPFPEAVSEQLSAAIAGVFRSWDSDRAQVYRRLNAIPGEWGTAVTVQAMVFGNMGEASATGVAFTRDPATGEKALYGEWLAQAQGEDVVAGLRTPHYLTRAARERAGAKPLSMEEAMPAIYADLARVSGLLEAHFRDMQDIEFTVERGHLWMLQTRTGERTAAAAVRMAVEMADEGLIDRAEAVRRVDARALEQLLQPMLDPDAPRDVLGRGLPASPGAACGAVALDPDTAERRAAAGEAVILVRTETGPEDIRGMIAAKGVLTARGGLTSHAAVVARGMGRPCVTGTSGLIIDISARSLRFGAREVAEGETITIDGANGEIMAGIVPVVAPEPSGDLAKLMGWAEGLY